MPENEYISLKEALKDVTDGQKQLLQSLSDLRVDIAERYATKVELKVVDDKIEKNQNKTSSTTFNVLATIIAVAAVFVAIFK